ncbi:type II toxin-antitoxin system ParD family antitoxin [Pleurocapsa sp. FMAR1]|uniref:type II toxin-antitoxin system ParD family antitoxin n=1 Tax=Pleurocapsa sp. FMAR1 TaxID=3040204 RepID=UPI0029C78392|nr:type II toxin-antitoxin system ParD family antitoxin [Pleurocapsa sp. FMAR1]
MNISLPESMRAYVEEQIKNGDYGTVSEYMRDLIRRDRDRKEQNRLESLLLEGLNSGEATPITENDWAEIRAVVKAKIEQKQ